MKCDEVQLELVSYHFGTISLGSRSEVESHLLSCGACLQSFLALKREIETSQSGPRPSAAARARLRSAVAQQVDGRRGRWSWWERPLALGLAAAAVVAATVTTRVLTSGPGAPPYGLATTSESSRCTESH